MSDGLAWSESSCSDDQGGACPEAALVWRKSSHRDSEGSNCVEVASCPRTVHVRDSRLGARSPRFAAAGGGWTAFVAYARTGA
ncbi:DUF397 domain-containing protein [Streptomyces sp. NEAU-W12]|uniref:DUF397 domain-containing protein n=1 Tax=Streptomyces sp. NEAU-W12 TaxID=2994668 RepID=UPI00224B5698|nr:DUF397 domain-containing protein [Streptomyces sp. NEAU-W12]MCX2927230.1 DUF397 domain-containing protein [Streptomyces sp. NEAU-W12]